MQPREAGRRDEPQARLRVCEAGEEGRRLHLTVEPLLTGAPTLCDRSVHGPAGAHTFHAAACEWCVRLALAQGHVMAQESASSWVRLRDPDG